MFLIKCFKKLKKNNIRKYKQYINFIYYKSINYCNCSYSDFFYIKTLFKQNKKYNLSLVFNKLAIISFSYRKFINISKNTLSKKNRFISHNSIILSILNTISIKKKIILVYKNITYLNLYFLNLFFKISKSNNILFYSIVLKTSYAFKHNKYYKKVGTIKKFRKKKYQSIFNKKYGLLYN